MLRNQAYVCQALPQLPHPNRIECLRPVGWENKECRHASKSGRMLRW